MRKLLAATLFTAAATLATLNTAQASTLAASASPQASSMLDMEAIHRAYFQMPEGAPAQALSWFEEQVNRYNHGAEFVSIAAQRAHLQSGQPVTVLSGYIDRDGQPGLNAASGDQVLFRFVQTAPLSSRGLSYEFVDGSGVVFYRGIRALPASAYYRAYYLGFGVTTPFISYYTPYARLGYLRTWRASYRLTPAYGSWYRGYIAARPYYAGRIAHYRRTYGVTRVRLTPSGGLPRIGVSARIGGRAAVRSTTVRTTVRPASHGRAIISKTVTRTVSRGPAARTTVSRTTTVASRPSASRAHRGHF
jgi:hypothetical protein